MQPAPDDQLRITSAQRERAVELVRLAAADGRLEFDEMNQRVGIGLEARTQGELRRIVGDLVPSAELAAFLTDITPPVQGRGPPGTSRCCSAGRRRPGGSPGPGRCRRSSRCTARCGTTSSSTSSRRCRSPRDRPGAGRARRKPDPDRPAGLGRGHRARLGRQPGDVLIERHDPPCAWAPSDRGAGAHQQRQGPLRDTARAATARREGPRPHQRILIAFPDAQRPGSDGTRRLAGMNVRAEGH
ncbi:DUF1707 domain-containing protein [Tessaracoccus sp. HDW20]|nr:DUF1707 domain-containing protein [Tessaracoccus coleopterorum]